jgi:REP element-mobilizing transposase RayT
MPSTHLSLHYRVIFASKDRNPLISPQWRDRLHAYLGGVLREMDAIPQAVGGVADHVHLLIGLRATHCLSDVVRDIKRASSEWIHKTIGDRTFPWQEGYGAFTVSASMREDVWAYIERQEEHHRTRTFRDEYLEFLRKSGVNFDERFVD